MRLSKYSGPIYKRETLRCVLRIGGSLCLIFIGWFAMEIGLQGLQVGVDRIRDLRMGNRFTGFTSRSR